MSLCIADPDRNDFVAGFLSMVDVWTSLGDSSNENRREGIRELDSFSGSVISATRRKDARPDKQQLELASRAKALGALYRMDFLHPWSRYNLPVTQSRSIANRSSVNISRLVRSR
jgi:hypothetical protein